MPDFSSYNAIRHHFLISMHDGHSTLSIEAGKQHCLKEAMYSTIIRHIYIERSCVCAEKIKMGLNPNGLYVVAIVTAIGWNSLQHIQYLSREDETYNMIHDSNILLYVEP